MSYVTLVQLAGIPGALELSQVASDPHGALVEPALLALTLIDGDRSSYPADEIAAADRTRERIEGAVAEADALIDGYLGKRYTLPLASPPALLAIWSRAIARYKLHGERISDEKTDPVVRDYRDALKFLSQIAEGKFSLGIEDPAQSPGLGEVRIESGQKVFGRAYLP